MQGYQQIIKTFKGVDEKMKLKKFTAALLSVAMLFCILPSECLESRVQAEGKITYKIATYGKNPSADCGCILEPDVPGTYPAAIFQHGDLSYSVVAANVRDAMTDWVNKGLIEPMIVVTPYVIQNGGYNSHEDFTKYQLPKVVERMEDGTFEKLISSKIDKSKKFALAGWSLGGAVTAYGGSKYREKFPYLGIISPSPFGLYPGSVWKSWMLNDDDTKDYKFNTDDDRFFFMAAGEQEPDYISVRDVYYTEFGEKENATKLTWKSGTHSWEYFGKSLFYFVYMLQHDGKEPTDDELALAFGKAPERTVVRPGDVVTKPELTGTVKFGGQEKCGFSLKANVSNSNAANSTPTANYRIPYSYHWFRDDKEIAYQREDHYILTAEDVGHKITCNVSSSIGKYSGVISATTGLIQKADGPAAPTGLTAVNCTNGQANGAIKNVTTAMEYKNVNASGYTSCKSTEITGLAKGTYYVRFKETDTNKSGAPATLNITDNGGTSVVTTTAKTTTTTTASKTTTKTTTTTAKPTTTTTTTTTKKTTTTTKATTTTKPTTTTTKATTTKATTTKATTTTMKATTTTTSATTTKLEKTIPGDTNLDTNVDMADAVLIMQCLANPNKYGVNGTASTHITPQGLANADVEAGDGVTPKDALKIGDYLAKKIPAFDE